MTRPQIIRADTLDLQDKSSPTAQDHSFQPEHPAPLGIGPAAPHQQAAIRQVEEERSHEEARLQNAWGAAGSTLRQEAGDADERNGTSDNYGPNGMQKDEQAIRLNGGVSGDGDDTEMQEADDDDDLDDDMMDKISSSPSIDDGGYSSISLSPRWPQRVQSLTPQSSPISPIVSSFDNITPLKFPYSISADSSPFCDLEEGVFLQSPFPISYSNTQSLEHRPGEYSWLQAIFDNKPESEADQCTNKTFNNDEMTTIEERLGNMNTLNQIDCQSESDDDSVCDILQPIGRGYSHPETDPFPEPASTPPRSANGTPHPRLDDDNNDDDSTTSNDSDLWEDINQRDDASDDISLSQNTRFIVSGQEDNYLRKTEDIDFEFVYALHTFVATVEGQANATKGDTMVLLDDSNSYWWLVRIVKDSSIGYLPAEHIETPTERLARLNKHRNIDLSATMLGDTAEKSKNPLKKAMRRRNAKTVQFAPPTYVEASDYDYSSDEDSGELFGGPEPKQVQQQQQQGTVQTAESEQDDNLKVQPLKVNGAKDSKGQQETQNGEDGAAEEDERPSEEMFDRPLDPKVSRNGTLRNTDSFFKDENTETRKITLTPNLLRDDSSTAASSPRERGPSLESLEKNGFADKVKDKKDKKEKKPGMLSGLFKRKDKKSKLDSQDSSDMERSEDMDRSSPQQNSDELERPSTEQQAPAPQRTLSKGKLQKNPRSRDDSPQKTKSILKTENQVGGSGQSEATIEPEGSKVPGSQVQPTMRMVQPDDGAREPLADDRGLVDDGPAPTPGSNNPFTNMAKSAQASEAKPEAVKQSKQRMQLDDFDSDEGSDPFADPDAESRIALQQQNSEPSGRLSESPVHVTAADALPISKVNSQEDRTPDPQHPPGLTTDSSSQETSSPISTPTLEENPMKTIPENTPITTFRSGDSSSPTKEALGANAIPPPSRPAPIPSKEREPSPPISSESNMLPAWSDASLRAYLDDGSEIRDMLLVVNDTTGVVPVGKDHPFMKDLFSEETKRVQGLSGELDRLLNGLMEKRMKRAGSGASKASTARSIDETTGRHANMNSGARW